MAIINNLPTRGGVKMELLWSNPRPTSAMASSTNVPFDFTKYDMVFVQVKPYSTYADSNARFIQVTKTDKWLGVHVPTDTFASYRNITVTDAGITFGTTAGYSYHNGGNATGTSYCIPIAVYGYKGKIETN